MIASANLRAHCHATEELDRVEKALLFLAGAGRVRTVHAAGHFGNRITIMDIDLNGPAAGAFLDRTAPSLDPRHLARTLESRLDQENVFHFRLDKQAAYLGRIVLTTSNDPIHARVVMKSDDRAGALAELAAKLGITRGP